MGLTHLWVCVYYTHGTVVKRRDIENSVQGRLVCSLDKRQPCAVETSEQERKSDGSSIEKGHTRWYRKEHRATSGDKVYKEMTYDGSS